MFIDGVGGYDRSGQQRAIGQFLILMQPEAPKGMTPAEGVQFTTGAPIRGIVRTMVLKQLGHFMMGSARIGKHSITLSGAYGSDGLPCSVPQEVYDKGIDLPPELIEAWNKGGGWNGAGSEAPAMREWARRTFQLKKS